VGEEAKQNFKYFQVRDFTASTVPNDHIDFFFSFGVFCHIPLNYQQEYLKNVFYKMRSGAHGILMNADFHRHNSVVKKYKQIQIVISSLKQKSVKLNRDFPILTPPSHEEYHWYHAGTSETIEMLQSIGFFVWGDIGLIPRDPVIHFQKP